MKSKGRALELYPEKLEWDYRDMSYDPNEGARYAYELGWDDARKELITKITTFLYDYNKKQVEKFGPKATLSCIDFTIPVNEFLNEIEEDESK